MKFSDFDTLTFDVVGTLIDFETGILDWFRPTLKRYGVSKTDEEVLTAFAAVEDRYQRETPEKPFTEMLPLIYRGMTSDWDIGFRGEFHRFHPVLAPFPRHGGSTRGARDPIPARGGDERRRVGAGAHERELGRSFPGEHHLR